MLGLCGLSLSRPYHLRNPMNYAVLCLWLFIYEKVFNSNNYGKELFILASFKSLQSYRFRRFVVSNCLTSGEPDNFRAKFYYAVCVWLFSHGKVFNIRNYCLEYFILDCFKSVQNFGFRRFVVPKILASRLKSATQYKPDLEKPVSEFVQSLQKKIPWLFSKFLFFPD